MTRERVLIARVGREYFGLPLGGVLEALDGVEVTQLPLTPNGVLGQCTHRGELLPVLDPLHALGAALDQAPTTLLVIVAEQPFALAVDDVTDMTTVHDDARRALPAGTDRAGLLTGLFAVDGLLVGAVDMDVLASTAGSLLTPGTR